MAKVSYKLFVGEGDNPDFESQVEEHGDSIKFFEFAAQINSSGHSDSQNGLYPLSVTTVVTVDGESSQTGPQYFNDATNYAMQLALADKHLKLAGKPGLTP